MHVRYDTRNEDDETRRERNARFDVESPELVIPDAGHHLWEWYFDMSARLRRVRDGACEPIPPSEFQAWVASTGQIVYPSEYAILGEMDLAYCDEMNKELDDYRAREKDRTAKPGKKGR